VALQEPVLRSVGLGFRWALGPRYADVRGELTEILAAATDAADNWAWDVFDGDPSILVWNEDRRLHVIVQPRGLDIVSEHPDIDAVVAVASEVLAGCLDALNLKVVTRVSSSAKWTLAAGAAADVEKALEDWLLSPRLRTTLGPIGGRPDDLILSGRFEADNGVVTMFKTEPVTDEQAVGGGFFISDMEASEFPPASLLVDLERQHTDEFDSADGTKRSEGVLQQVLSQGSKLLATVGARDDLPDD